MNNYIKSALLVSALLTSVSTLVCGAERETKKNEQTHQAVLQALPPLSKALAYKDWDTFRQLLAAGEDPNVINPITGMSPMFELLSTDCAAHMLEAMIEQGAQIHQPAEDGTWPIHRAATQKSPECLQVLVKAGASLEQTDASGSTPVFYAVKYNSPNMVKYLRTQDVDVMHTNDRGMDIFKLALFYMVVYDYRETVDEVREILEQEMGGH